MRYRSPWLPFYTTVWLGLAAPAGGQTIRQVSLNTATGQIDRRYLPADQPFDFLIRASSELREFRGEYRSSTDTSATVPVPWLRRDGTKSNDATLRINDLRAGVTYQFTFVLVHRPTGNEGRLIEANVLDALRDAVRAQPDQPLEAAVALAAPRVRSSLLSVLPRASPLTPSPLSGDPGALKSALETRGIDVLHNDYRSQLGLVEALRTELRRERASLTRAVLLRRALNTIASRLDQGGGFAELRPALAGCRQVRDSSALTGPSSIRSEVYQLALLSTLKDLDATLGSCRALLRDVRLPRYARLFSPAGTGSGANGVADLLIPVADRLEALRSATERLVGLWRKRESTLGQVATDLRRTLDTRVIVSDTLTASFATASTQLAPPGATFGIALLGTYAPCSITTSCIRIVPAFTLGFRLTGLLGGEVGLTLAETEAPGRTRHLFWFTSAMAGLTMRLGANRAQRLGAGALILRRAEASDFDSFQLGGYVSFTLYDFRL